MILIDGKKAAAELREELKKEVSELKTKFDKVPGLTVILIGDMTPSQIYVRNKEKSANEVGLKSEVIKYPDTVEEKTVLEKIEELNKDATVSGILVQLPLPPHIDSNKIIEAIVPEKDVDGFSSENVGKLSLNKSFISPCTPKGVMKMLESIKCDLRGKDCVIIGASNIVGRPMSMELLNAGATVQVCHKGTKNITEKTKSADVIIAAAGVANLVKADWVKEGAVVIDVGINRLEDGTLAGDVDFEGVKDIASAISPVPGGVGPMTIAVLLENTLIAYQAKL
mgnify:CR=1 FL=1